MKREIELKTGQTRFTRCGYRVRIICTDKEPCFNEGDPPRPVVGLIASDFGREVVALYRLDGRYSSIDQEDHNYDIMGDLSE